MSRSLARQRNEPGKQQRRRTWALQARKEDLELEQVQQEVAVEGAAPPAVVEAARLLEALARQEQMQLCQIHSWHR